MILLLFALALQAAPPEPSAAKPAPPTVAPLKVKAQAEDPYEKVCRHEQRTGSRIDTPICHTREEWARIQEGSRAFMDAALHPTGCAPGATC